MLHNIDILEILGFAVGSVIKNLPANTGDVNSIPGEGRSAGEGNGHPLQYSCLEYPMDREAQQVTRVYKIAWGHKRVRHHLVTKQ